MNRYKETFDTWNKIANLYQDRFMELNLYNESYDFFCNTLADSKARILDMCCGPGNITKYLLSNSPKYKILGIDVAKNMVELAKKNNPQADFKILDSRKIGTIKDQFDGIICGFCLPYLSQKEVQKLIENCRILLKPNGILYLSFVDGNPEKSGFQTSATGDRVYFYYHEETNLLSSLLSNGFETLKKFEIEYKNRLGAIELHHIIVARRV